MRSSRRRRHGTGAAEKVGPKPVAVAVFLGRPDAVQIVQVDNPCRLRDSMGVRGEDGGYFFW